MSIAPEYLLREHEREVRARAKTARLIELAKCCKPSNLARVVARVRERFSPAPCCA